MRLDPTVAASEVLPRLQLDDATHFLEGFRNMVEPELKVGKFPMTSLDPGHH